MARCASIVLSIVLTVVVNLVLWLFPGGRRVADGFGRLAHDADDADRRAPGQRADSHVPRAAPWKAMLIGSIVLTVVLNLLLMLSR